MVEFALDVNGDAKALRDAEKAARRAAALHGTLEPAMRYRALVNTLKQETDFIDLADRKARFALVVMGLLNAVVVVVAVKGGDAVPTRGVAGSLFQAELGIYVLAAVYYIGIAIESLRPRGKTGRPTEPVPHDVAAGESMRLLFHADIVQRSRADYARAWNTLRFDSLITEMADQVYMVSAINTLKFRALGRLYGGLGVLTGLVALQLLTIVVSRWMG